MSAGWDTLRAALDNQDYAMATTTMLENLDYTNEMELLPMLRGVLAEVIKREDASRQQAEARRAKKGSAFGSHFNKDEKPEEKEAGPVASDATRRWRRTLRAVFNGEAAVAMLNEMIEQYQGAEFRAIVTELREHWRLLGPGANKMADMEATCMKHVMGPTLERYGFEGGEKGSKEFKAVVGELATVDKETKDKNHEASKIVMTLFLSNNEVQE
mmetsp:Transcript_116602/g.249319  ORF Transcript_116602/g.249319 Transcript_116602/m.249319 type:complete len:214 (-) Transcript_116602:172-813(-)